MDICIMCGTIAMSSASRVRCKNGHGDMLEIGKCMRCGVELGYLIQDDLYGPEKLACSNCIKEAIGKSE